MDLFKVREELGLGKTIFDLKLRVTYYARVSTDKDEQLNSLDNQIFYQKDFIKKNPNWTFVEGYVDEGISGRSIAKREDFLRMICDAKKGMFDLIITKEISRFSRSTLDSIKYTQDLLSYGVGVLFQSDNINTILQDSELRLTIMASVAQEEVRKLSERVKFGIKRSIEKELVIGNNVIYGYDKFEGKLTINELEAEMVRMIFDLYSTGKYGFDKVAKILDEKGYKNRKGKSLDKSTLRDIVVNPKYKGFYCTNRVRTLDYKGHKLVKVPREEWKMWECKDKIPAIVSDEVWEKANEILKRRGDSLKNAVENKDVFKHRFPFTSLLYCKEHNVPFYRVNGLKRANRPVWSCSVYVKQGVKGCKSPILLEEELFIIFKQVLGKFMKNKSHIIAELMEEYKELSKEKNYDKMTGKLQEKIKSIEYKKDKLLDLSVSSHISNTEFFERNEKLNSEIKEYESEIQKIEMERLNLKEVRSEIEELNKAMSTITDVESNIEELIRTFVSRVIVSSIDGDRNKIHLEIYYKIGENENIFLEQKKRKGKKSSCEYHFRGDERDHPSCYARIHRKGNGEKDS